MTTDIVTRLRAVAETGCDPDLPHDAAAEIERLRDALAIKTAMLDEAPKNMAKLARIAAILDPLRALEAAATEGPWRWKKDSIDYGYVGPGGHPTVLYGENCEGAVSEDNPDGRLLAAARNALPALLREIQETP